MPLVRLTYPRGALTPEQKPRIAEALTEIALDAEVDAVTDAGRMVTLVHFNEAVADDWAVGGQTISALDVAQFINSDLAPSRRAEIAARSRQALAPMIS